MMQDERFVVRYIAVNNCFAHLPAVWLRRLSKTKANAIKLSHNGEVYYLSWFPRPSADTNVCFSAKFAHSLGITEGDEVFVSSLPDSPSVSNITVTPKNSQDWEIVELQADKIQSTLLDQITVVAKNQPIVVWVSKSLWVILTVDSLEPNYVYGKLEQFTEVMVSPVSSSRGDTSLKSAKLLTNLEPTSGVWSTIKNLFPSNNDSNQSVPCNDVQPSLDEYKKKRKFLDTFRVINLPRLDIDDSLFMQPYHVFIHERNLMNVSSSREFQSMIFKMKKVREHLQHVKVTNTNFLKEDSSSLPKESVELIVQFFVIEDVLKKYSNDLSSHFELKSIHKSVYVSEDLLKNLKLRTGSKVLVETADFQETKINLIEVFPFDEKITEDSFRNYVQRNSRFEKILLNSKTALSLYGTRDCILRFSPESRSYVFLDEDILRGISVKINNVQDNPYQSSTEQIDDLGSGEEFIVSSLSGLQDLLSKCKFCLTLSLGLHETRNFLHDRENILIYGDVGSGKTTFCKSLLRVFREKPYFVHTHFVDCKALKGKKVEMMQKIMSSAMSDCSYHEPSILFLDGLESVASSPPNDEENTPDTINAARIADMIFSMTSEYQKSRYISLIATCVDPRKLSQRLRAAKGTHFFQTVLKIPNLKKEDRIEILKSILRGKLHISEEIEWDNFGNKTEGWVTQDLANMAEKAAFAAWKRHVKNKLISPLTLLEEDMASSFQNSLPMSLHGVNIYKGLGHCWSDIGGLEEVKRALTEILHWPLKYSEIFKNAPIKYQGSVLLYGMPGTGKTMLAGAIAKECELNLISVKGPELLSKYIGASEEAVRDIFEKAQRAKPCVLFFDEFDSLAPRRGHDSTGVTDRVVNQLLTQLDGVEDREGVAVVAASSRPDLLDPALLRPGRLDKALLCPLPSEADREEILRALCKDQNLDTKDLDLRTLAEMSSGLTGADLKSMLAQARLTAVEEVLQTLSPGEQADLKRVKITQEQLCNSMKSTRPSLTTEEKLRYTKIYARFSKGDTSTDDFMQNQRSTLA
ncbi:peroxisome biogenesis factor 1 [Orussus abietinus]|uniref:peroxisome biogenesis factor 1 n=1 Tax=Orussus abietinus TaxID=222816 RepID=UPI0006261F65|nr:peroxisome biogenesis factor 1 [Orussus abietinus]